MSTKLELRAPTVEAIYASYERRARDDERTYLGASAIGDPCWRKLWYGFRWVSEPEKFDGRMLRLFDTGHREEARMIDDLRAAGVTVYDRDPDDPSKQIGISDLGGHFRGHLDGVAIGVPEAPKTWHVVECKTHNKKSFGKLRDDGVDASKPLHVAQSQIYMHYEGLTRTLYLAHGKDDEGLIAERFKYDMVQAAALIAKAENIIFAASPPPRLHDDPSRKVAFDCRFCRHRGVCHEGDWARRNCRTCIHSTPMLDGDARWVCERHRCDLSAADQKAGCGDHLFIPYLVPGEQIDVDEGGLWIEYRLPDGTIWRDDTSIKHDRGSGADGA